MYDVAIIGLGCAGYTAAIYCGRYKLRTFLVGTVEGGTGLAAAEVGDWPGDEQTTGPELMERMSRHARSFETVTHKVTKVDKLECRGAPPAFAEASAGRSGRPDERSFQFTLEGGDTVDAKTVIFAMGAQNRKLGVPGEEEYAGKGVTYCATCDAYFYRGKDVAVVGGGDSAVEGAAIAAQVARKVYLIHRRAEFRASPYWVNRVKARDNVVFVLERSLAEIVGDGKKVTGVRLDKSWSPGPSPSPSPSPTLAVDGVFVEIGAVPRVGLPQHIGCELDERGHVKVDAGMETSVPGAFAAGDISSGSNHFAQFTTAAGEGAVAANSVFHFLEGD